MGEFHPNRWQGGNENKWIGKLEPYQILARVRDKTQSLSNCHVTRVGEIAICLPLLSCSKGMLSYPERANQPLPRLHFHSSENALDKP